MLTEGINTFIATKLIGVANVKRIRKKMSNKTTFTAEQLSRSLDEVANINSKFPDLPIKLFHQEYDDGESIWRGEYFPMTFKKIGEDTNVVVNCEEYYVGGGEGDGNDMRIILSVGYGDSKRYFKKTGFLDSWDNGLDDYRWDGALYEVKPMEVKRIEYQAI